MCCVSFGFFWSFSRTHLSTISFSTRDYFAYKWYARWNELHVSIWFLSACSHRVRRNLKGNTKKITYRQRSTNAQSSLKWRREKNTRTSTVMTPVKHFQRHLKWPEQNENNQINNDRMGIYRHMRVCYGCDGR